MIQTISFAAYKPVAKKLEHVTSARVDGTLGALDFIGKSLRDIGLADDNQMTFIVTADHATLDPKSIERHYIIERKKL